MKLTPVLLHRELCLLLCHQHRQQPCSTSLYSRDGGRKKYGDVISVSLRPPLFLPLSHPLLQNVVNVIFNARAVWGRSFRYFSALFRTCACCIDPGASVLLCCAFKMHLWLSDWITVAFLCFYVLSNATPEASFVYFHTVFVCRKALWEITDVNTLGSHHYYGSMMCPDSWPATRNVSGGVWLQESLPLSWGYDSYLSNTWHERSCGDND